MSVRKLSRAQLRAMGYKHGRKNRVLCIHRKRGCKAFQEGYKAGIAAFSEEAYRNTYARL